MDMLGQFSLKGKVALVTGASHGIGFSMAVALAGAGAEIAFNGHSPDRLKAAEAEYAARGCLLYTSHRPSCSVCPFRQ